MPREPARPSPAGRRHRASPAARAVGGLRPHRLAAMEETLPYRLYLDAEVFAAERERLFARQWFHVGRDEDVPEPGDWSRVEVVGEQLILVRGDDGQLRGFANTCRHRGAELCPLDGPVSGHAGRVLRCPYHHWTYGLDGRLRAAPHLGEPLPEVGLFAVGVAVWGGFVFVCLRPDAVALAGRTDRRRGRSHRQLPAGLAPPRRQPHLRGGRQLEGHRRELQRVLPLRPGPPGAVRAGTGLPAGRRVRSARGTTGSPTATAPGRSRPAARPPGPPSRI